MTLFGKLHSSYMTRESQAYHSWVAYKECDSIKKVIDANFFILLNFFYKKITQYMYYNSETQVSVHLPSTIKKSIQITIHEI